MLLQTGNLPDIKKVIMSINCNQIASDIAVQTGQPGSIWGLEGSEPKNTFSLVDYQ